MTEADEAAVAAACTGESDGGPLTAPIRKETGDRTVYTRILLFKIGKKQ